jgi:hypothetical protein
MKTIAISKARRCWAEGAATALRAPVLLTRHGRAWVLVLPLSRRLLEILGDVATASHREARLDLCALAVEARGGAVLVMLPRSSSRVAIMPAGDTGKMLQN